MTDEAERPPEKRLHGRRKGRPLSPRRTGVVARMRTEIGLDPTTPSPGDAAALFPVPVGDVRLEIGCGAGEHLVHEAKGAPGTGFIGVEPFEQGFARMAAAIDEAGLRNVRIFSDDATLILDWLPDASLARVDLLYPDPWPKRRHWKRRFISDANLDHIARALRPGGELRVASDIPAYIDWTLLTVLPRREFDWTARRADDWRRPWEGWPGTRYEAKAIRAGRVPAYLTFERTKAG